MSDPAAKPVRNYFWLLQVCGWLGYWVYSFLNSLAHGKSGGYWTVVTAPTIAGFVCTVGMRYALRPMMSLSVPAFFLAALGPMLLCAGLMGLAYVLSLIEWCGDECRPTRLASWIAYMGGFIWVILSWTGLYFGIKNYSRLQLQTQTALKANAIAHQAQLKMLRYQLNPHFLFNTLNAISTLILDQRGDIANRMVTSLSAFLRHSLDADPMQRVTLKQELDALNLYLGIEKVRFTDRLSLDIQIEPEAYSALLPSLLLQPLIENAIKFAVSKRVEGGTVGVAARRDGDMLEIRISDDGPGCPHFNSGLPPGNGVGLRNTQERLRVLFDGRQTFQVRNREPHGVEVLLRLPYETGGAPRE